MQQLPHEEGRLLQLAHELERQGIRTASLAELQPELDAVQSPGVLGRVTAGARAKAARHWHNVVGELQESKEAAGLLTRRVRGEPLTDEDVDKVRAQLGDLLRLVPAGLLAIANSALPVPGTGLLTPWLLARLGLMPSRWREAHLLAELTNQERDLRSAGHVSAADQLRNLTEEIEREADAREDAARSAALLTFWDANGDGKWNDDERAAYELAAARLRDLPAREHARRQWFVRVDQHLFGPCRLTELPALPTHALISRGGKSGWTALADLLARDPPSGDPQPGPR